MRVCALIDRGHRELPIEAAFVGKRIATEPQQIIEVHLNEQDSQEKVLLLENVDPGTPAADSGQPRLRGR